MQQPLSFFNCSLTKLLRTEPDNFNRAGIKILFSILVFTLVKTVIVIAVTVEFKQYFQLERAIVMLVIYIGLLKIVLANKSYTKSVAHLMVWMGLFLIWSNAFLFAQTINILTLQFIFMLILSSFYLLSTRSGIIYAVAGTLPVVLHLIINKDFRFSGMLPDELASPGYEIIVVLNFITIVICHYLFQQAFKSNIDEKEALNKALQLAVEEANRSADAKSEFLSTMTHELRTPLNSVIGISQLLLQDTHSPEQEEGLQILKFSAVNLYSLINNILDFNKLGSDKLHLENIPVKLDNLMKDTCMGLRFQAEQKKIDFVLEIDEILKGRCLITDPTRITQVIYNLAGNAIKFTEQGRVSISVEVRSIAGDDLTIRFSVTDTGIGISRDQQEAIFESFTQASASTARNFGGTGLGLAIVKRLLVLFDSDIQLQSSPETGSTFFFDITLKQHEEQKPPVLTAEAIESDMDLAGLKILVAEDNHMNRLLLTKIFSRWNITPEFAVNGQEAIDKVSLGDYNVVLMDLHMPLVDGYEATKAIRAMTDPVKANIQIVAVTASVSDNMYQKIRAAGMNDYLYKPFQINDLYGKLVTCQLSADSDPPLAIRC